MATWYRTGTVAVTNGSKVVTGTGTAFVSNVKLGDAFVGPDGRPYEIAGVVSDTSLTLESGYLGSTASAQSYAVQPTRGVTVQLVSDVQSLIGDYANVKNKAGAGLFGDGTDAAPGVSFDGDRDTGFSRPAANQIAASTGGARRTLLSSAGYQIDVPVTGTAVTQSATDATPGRLLTRGFMGLGQAISLGGSTPIKDRNLAPGFYSYIASAVPGGPESQSFYHAMIVTRDEATGRTGFIDWRLTSTGPVFWMGVLSDGVLTWRRLDPERGSNPNGEFVRFADGTQICTRKIAAGSITTNGTGAAPDPYRTNSFDGIWAAEFSSDPLVSVEPLPPFDNFSLNQTIAHGHVRRVTGVSYFGVLASRPAGQSSTPTNFEILLTAIGRWF